MGNIICKYAFFPPSGPYDIEDYPYIQFVTNRYGHSVPFIHIKPKIKKYPYVVIYCHGNAQDIITTQDFLEYQSSIFGIEYILFDYPGYSFSRDKNGKTLKPSEEFCYANADAICDYVENTLSVEPKNILPYGRSIGSGIATYIAEKKSNYAGLILQSPLLSAVRVVSSYSPPFDIFCNYKRIENITLPTYIIHGTNDSVIDWKHGLKLYSLSKSTRKKCLWIEGADHNDVEDFNEKLFNDNFIDFLDSLSNETNNNNNNSE